MDTEIWMPFTATQTISTRACAFDWRARASRVWSYDFVENRTHGGMKYRMLNVIDEFTHECLAILIARRLKPSM